MYCFLLQIFMFQLSSAFTPDYTPTQLPQPMPAWTHLRPPKSTTHLAIFLIDCIETRGVVGHLPPTLWKVGGGGGHILLFMVNIVLITEFFSIKEEKVKLTRDLKPFFFFFFLFVCLFVCLFV
jgi:hypothetical protein